MRKKYGAFKIRIERAPIIKSFDLHYSIKHFNVVKLVMCPM